MRYATILAALPLPVLLLTACADGDYPALLPTEQVLAEPTLPDSQADPVATAAEAGGRADALRARADALRGPVIEPGIARRMAGAGAGA